MQQPVTSSDPGGKPFASTSVSLTFLTEGNFHIAPCTLALWLSFRTSSLSQVYIYNVVFPMSVKISHLSNYRLCPSGLKV